VRKRITGVTDSRLKQFPEWARGPARVIGEEIVLDAGDTEVYRAFDPEHTEALLFDLMALENLDRRSAEAFARKHGLLWHGPPDLGIEPIRESILEWRIAGYELKKSAALYLILSLAVANDSAQPVQQYFRRQRDRGEFTGRIPDNPDECLRFASKQLAERIARELDGFGTTFVSSCGGLPEGVQSYGPLDFRFGDRPSNLVAVANAQLGRILVKKQLFKYCAECGQMFWPKRKDQIYHKACGDRKRQRERRARRAADNKADEL
jgi:hypothetical protein